MEFAEEHKIARVSKILSARAVIDVLMVDMVPRATYLAPGHVYLALITKTVTNVYLASMVHSVQRIVHSGAKTEPVIRMEHASAKIPIPGKHAVRLFL